MEISRQSLVRTERIREQASKKNDLEKLVSCDKKIRFFLQGLSPLERYAKEIDSIRGTQAYTDLQHAKKVIGN